MYIKECLDDDNRFIFLKLIGISNLYWNQTYSIRIQAEDSDNMKIIHGV